MKKLAIIISLSALSMLGGCAIINASSNLADNQANCLSNLNSKTYSSHKYQNADVRHKQSLKNSLSNARVNCAL